MKKLAYLIFLGMLAMIMSSHYQILAQPTMLAECDPSETSPSGLNEANQSSCFGNCIVVNTIPAARTACITKAQNISGHLTPDMYISMQVPPLIQASPHTKNMIPFAAHQTTHRGMISTTLRRHGVVYHPNGGTLFPKNGDIASQLDAVIAAIKTTDSYTNAPITPAPYPVQGPASTEVSHFVPMWRKFQYLVLQDLYIYLTGVYTTFTLTQCTTSTASTASGGASPLKGPSVCDEATFLTLQQETAIREKMIIVSHLLNIIQQQMHFICSHHVPLAPTNYSLKAGALMLKHDLSSDPLFLMRDFSKPFFDGDLKTDVQREAHGLLTASQSAYLKTIGTILKFFSTYTHELTKPDPNSAIAGATAFYPLAVTAAMSMADDPHNRAVQNIRNKTGGGSFSFKNAVVKNAVTKSVANPLANLATLTSTSTQKPIVNIDQSNASAAKSRLTSALGGIEGQAGLGASMARVEELRALSTTPINPPLILYNDETLRAIKIIPATAARIPKGGKPVPPPAQILAAVANNVRAKDFMGNDLGYPIAFREDGKLFINIPQASLDQGAGNTTMLGGPFAQEIIPQPTWLDSYDGVIRIVRACLGDFTQLVGMNICGACNEAIICRASGTPCAEGVTSACNQMLDEINAVHAKFVSAVGIPTTAEIKIPAIAATVPTSRSGS